MDLTNTFAGIEPGGLKDTYDIKLSSVTCSTITEPLSPDQLNYIFQSEGLVNYFSYTVALKELLESGHIKETKANRTPNMPLLPLGLDSAHGFSPACRVR